MFQTVRETFNKNTGVRTVELSYVHNVITPDLIIKPHSHEVNMEDEKYNAIPIGKDWVDYKES